MPWPPPDHWAIRSKRRQVTVFAVLLVICAVNVVWGLQDRHTTGDTLAFACGLVGVPMFAVLLVMTLRRR